jgi:hypothetical protein
MPRAGPAGVSRQPCGASVCGAAADPPREVASVVMSTAIDCRMRWTGSRGQYIREQADATTAPPTASGNG